MERGDKITLQVNMFGGLAINYEGKNISVGKNKTAKYVQLLEIVWLSGEAGIQKEQLTNILYDREDTSKIPHDTGLAAVMNLASSDNVRTNCFFVPTIIYSLTDSIPLSLGAIFNI